MDGFKPVMFVCFTVECVDLSPMNHTRKLPAPEWASDNFRQWCNQNGFMAAVVNGVWDD